jgi:hypothetical protein
MRNCSNLLFYPFEQFLIIGEGCAGLDVFAYGGDYGGTFEVSDYMLANTTQQDSCVRVTTSTWRRTIPR